MACSYLRFWRLALHAVISRWTFSWNKYKYTRNFKLGSILIFLTSSMAEFRFIFNMKCPLIVCLGITFVINILLENAPENLAEFKPPRNFFQEDSRFFSKLKIIWCPNQLNKENVIFNKNKLPSPLELV